MNNDSSPIMCEREDDIAMILPSVMVLFLGEIIQTQPSQSNLSQQITKKI